MKSVIIIAIALVLLIPLSVFAQEVKTSYSNSTTFKFEVSNMTESGLYLNVTINLDNFFENNVECNYEEKNSSCNLVPIIEKLLEQTYSETDNQEFSLKDVLEMLISVSSIVAPIIIGVVTAKTITKSWQFRSAKIKMKKEVLEVYAQSAIFQSITMHQYLGNFLNFYGERKPEEYDEDQGMSTVVISKSKFNEFPPSKKFAQDIIEMQKRLDHSKLESEPKLLSLIHLYYRNPDLLKEYFDIQIKVGKLKNFVYGFLNSETADEAAPYYKKYTEILLELKDMNYNLREKLVEKKIQIPEKEN